MSNQKGAKIMAILALFGIIISIVGTGIVVIVERNAQERQVKKQIEEYLKNNSGNFNTGNIEVLPGSPEKSTGEISTGTITN